MACYHPLQAYKTPSGEVVLAKHRPDGTGLRLPCGNCLGCVRDRAKAWALRCHLELSQHPAAAFTTLTYSDDHLPVTLQKRHLQLWLKRLRKRADRPVRFFASGEYGEQTNRPHYHALLYGLGRKDEQLVDATWPFGHTLTYDVTPAAIAYVAGYTAKKIGWRQRSREEQVDPETGEVYTWQPPFIQMSRRPGIGGHARAWPQSWRLYAIHNGQRMPVPRFLHESWKEQATKEELEQLDYEKAQLNSLRDTSTERLQAAEKIAIAQQRIRADRRKL